MDQSATPSPSASPPPLRGSFDDVYRANGSGLLSTVSTASSSSSRSLSVLAAAISGNLDDNDDDDEDTNMSNGDEQDDDAMSGTSSLGMDDGHGDNDGDRDSATQFVMVLESDAMEIQPTTDSGDGHAATTSLSDALSSPVTSPRKRKRKIMWLHAEHTLAISKSVLRTAPHPQFSQLDDGGDCQSKDHHSHSSVFPAVEWAHGESRYDDPEGSHLVAVKNQVVASQLRVLSNEPFQLTTDRTNWFLPQGHTPRCRVDVETSYLPQAIHVETFLIGYVEAEKGDKWMETLETRTSSHTLGLEHAIYLRVRIDATIPAGVYEIPIHIFTQHAGFTNEELSWTTSIHVRVANVTLPPPSDWKFHLDLWQHPTSIARAHGGVPLWSDAHFVLIDRYFKQLAQLGQKCVTIVVTEMPWAGQHCYTEISYPSSLYEHAILDVYEDGSSGLSIDFQHFDRLVSLAESHHMAKEIEVFGLLSIWKDPSHGFGSPVEVEVENEASEPRSPGSAAGTDPDQRPPAGTKRPLDSWRIRCVHRSTNRIRYLHKQAEIETFFKLFYDHCVARDLVDRVRICADEPHDLSAFYAQMAFLTQIAPRFKVKVALNHLAFLQHAPSQVVDFVPLLPIVCEDLQVTTQWKNQIHDTKNGKFCWYVCCEPQFPNQFVSSPLTEGEMVGFLTYFLGLDGFLRWNYCLWPAKPWTNLKWRSPSWKVGDMYFVLPGLDGFPVVTLRFESLRIAIQSYELLWLAEKTLPQAEFETLKSEIATLIWRSPGHAQFGKYVEKKIPAEDLYSLDGQDYENARRLIIDALALAASLQPSSSSSGANEPFAVAGAASPRRY